jgi:hypothetical protein
MKRFSLIPGDSLIFSATVVMAQGFLRAEKLKLRALDSCLVLPLFSGSFIHHVQNLGDYDL